MLIHQAQWMAWVLILGNPYWVNPYLMNLYINAP
jgi:hypothetical protein